jgi:hypothetical protein
MLLSEDQQELATQTLLMYKSTIIMHRPLKMGDLVRALEKLVPLEGK